MVSLIAKINDKSRPESTTSKIYTSKKFLIKKGHYPSETALLNGIIFTVMNADEIFNKLG